MHHYEVTGYIINECETVCPACISDNEKDSPMFAGDETDFKQSCSKCGNEIYSNVIGDYIDK